MVILTNCLTEQADEGCLKVANSLTRRIKKKCPSTTVVSYQRKPAESDHHLSLNKLFLNRRLFSLLRKKAEPVLYIPFSACTKATALRIFVLSILGGVPVNVLFVAVNPLPGVFQRLLRWSRARFFVLSANSAELIENMTGKPAIYLKTGVDTRRFCPVSPEQKLLLRKKYGIAQQKTVVLHVGHLKRGRNVATLLDLRDDFHAILVVSTQTADSVDVQLRQELLNKSNVTIVDTYQSAVQELYQLSDVYYFPVVEDGNCIDVPLSVLEAAACGIPVATTDYGELRQLISQEGFTRLTDFAPDNLNACLRDAALSGENPRAAVEGYHWDLAVDKLLELNMKEI